MKKQMIFLTILSALACMTGCGTDKPAANANSSAAELQSAADSAAAAPAEGTEITSEQNANTTAAESAAQTETSRTELEKQNTTAEAQQPADFSAVAGEWIRGDAVYANCYLNIDAAGKFTVESIKGERFGGTVKSENGAYSLYKADGSLWNSFTNTKSGSSKRLVSKKNTDTAKIQYDDVNEDEYNLAEVTFVSCDVKGGLLSFAGDWHEEIGEDADCPTLKVNENGSFVYTAKDGKETKGNIYLTAEIYPNDAVSYWFNFFRNDGSYWLGFNETAVPNDMYQIASGQDGAVVFNHVWNGEYEFDGQLTVPAGQTVTVRSKPSDSAASVKEVTETMDHLNFFTCNTKGWYGVMLDKDKPDESFGYVRTEYIRKITENN